MSYSIFVQRFVNGQDAPLDAAIVTRHLAPHLDVREDDFGFLHIRMADGGGADIYTGATGTDQPLTGLMIDHFSAGDVLELVVQLAQTLDAVIIAPGYPILLIEPGQRDHLPPELQAETVVIANGADLLSQTTG